jgi:multidrug efflux system membrane fusion protein
MATSTRSRFLLWLLGAVALGGGGYWGYQKYYGEPTDAVADKSDGKTDAKSGKGKGKGGRPVAPVAVAVARSGNVNVYLNGLGTVTPLRTVTVRSRVDGQLMRVLFTEGQVVKQGDLLAEIDPRPFQAQLLQVEGQMQRDLAQLANARVDLERYRLLLKQDSIAEQQVASQEALVRQLEGGIKVNQGQIDNAKLQLVYARVTAPIGGRLGLRQVDPGNIVRSGDANGLVVITQFNPTSVLFTIPQDNLPQVLKRLQSREKVPVEAYDREQKTRLASGRLLTADNQIDTATGTIRLRAEFPNDENLLFPNQFVNVRMLVDTREDAITVPASAIQRGAQGLFVYVANEDQTVSMRAVKTGVTEGTRIEIESGVKARERVVIDGMDRLRDGMRVEIAERRAFDGKGEGGTGKGKGRRGKGGDAAGAAKGDASKGDSAKGETAKGETAKGEPAKDDGASADAPQGAKPQRKKPAADGAASEAPKDGAPAADAAKSDTGSADAAKGERRKRGDGEWRKKKKDAEGAAP